MKISIICVGSELLEGKTVDTNSQYIIEKLRPYGLKVHTKIIVIDALKEGVKALLYALETSDIVIITGGLGPTLDDVTRDMVSKGLNLPLEENQEVIQQIREIFKSNNKDYPINNDRQGFFPHSSKILSNPIGTAAGFFIEFHNKWLFALPGPPTEMKLMFENHVLTKILAVRDTIYFKKDLEIIGIGESTLEEKLTDIIQEYTSINFGTYALDGRITLSVTAVGNKGDDLERTLLPIISKIKERIGEYIYSVDGEGLEETILRLLMDEELTLSTAESCTGGLLASLLTRLPGISKVYDGGFVSYSNEFKANHLSIPMEVIKKYGAVSKETAQLMLEGLKSKTNTSCGISITGIAGPTGGTKEKPVGLVYIGIYTPKITNVYKYNFYGSRERIQNTTALTALNLLRQSLKKEKN